MDLRRQLPPSPPPFVQAGIEDDNCGQGVRLRRVLLLGPSSGESIDRTNDLGHLKPKLLAQSPSEEQLVTSLGIEINGGSPPGDGWWEYITANKNLPHCSRGRGPARWQLSTPEGSGPVWPESLLLKGLPASRRNEKPCGCATDTTENGQRNVQTRGSVH